MARPPEDNPQQKSAEPGEVSLPRKKPLEKELHELTPEAMVAYAARCAMRVQPLVGPDSFGGFDRATVKGHIVALDIALTTAAAASPASAAFPARSAAASAARAAASAAGADHLDDDPGSRASAAAYAAFAAACAGNAARATARASTSSARDAASYAASAASASARASAVSAARAAPPGAASAASRAAALEAHAAAAVDFEFLLKQDQAKRVARALFARPLWPDQAGGIPKGWEAILNRWVKRMDSIGLGSICDRYSRMVRGEGIDSGGATRRINNWLAGQPGEGRKETALKRKASKKKAPKEAPTPEPDEVDVVTTDKVRAHDDEPATIDLLNRKAFAGALAERIRNIRASRYDGAFLVNLHGPWGSGKSTLLNFIEDELTGEDAGDDPWLVVRFNAWEKQNAGPPWWTLMDAVYRQALARLRSEVRWWQLNWRPRWWPFNGPDWTWQFKWRPRWWPFIWPAWVRPFNWRAVWLWIAEHWWRFSVRRGYLLIASAVVLWIIIAILWQVPTARLAENAKTISTILGAVVTLGGVVFAATRTLFAGTAAAAKSFSDAARSPTRKISEHFGGLLAHIKSPVIVMIDDLDRCRGDYVVDLLEGTQTLYRQGKVTYVIAADRRWLCASYQKRYEHFGDALDEPGRPLGYLFVEKIFQLSATVPRLAPALKARFWRELLDVEEEAPVEEVEPPVEEAIALAEAELERMTDEKEILGKAQSFGIASVRGRAYRQVAVKQLARPEVTKRTEHALLPYAELLDGNPRSMKRLVNAYGVMRAACILADVWVEAGPLARWTILALRWPVLADRLRRRPEVIVYLGEMERIRRETEEETLPAVVAELKPLFVGEDVQRVVSHTFPGADSETVLTRQQLERLVTLQSGDGEESDVGVA
ncbi:MAG: hypothetical protein JSV91_13740 [Phycisphaerales bacterium]|nr:MAG: hypothetical protein JSV91_13740 [Phycisphaerales bacterium]